MNKFFREERFHKDQSALGTSYQRIKHFELDNKAVIFTRSYFLQLKLSAASTGIYIQVFEHLPFVNELLREKVIANHVAELPSLCLFYRQHHST